MSESTAMSDTSSLRSESDEGPRVLTIFDWDDTLFPTTWAHERGAGWDMPKMGAPDNNIQVYLAEFIRAIETAKAHGDVCIVTFAKRPWVHSTIAWLLPPYMHDYLEVQNIPIVYAREMTCADDCNWGRGLVGGASFPDLRKNEMLVMQKNAAMLSVLKGNTPLKHSASSASISTMAGSPGGEYTHVVAIGDGDCEMIAAHDLHLQLDQDIVTKTVRLKTKPTLAEVSTNLSAIAEGFGALAAHNRPAHVVLRGHTPLCHLLQEPESRDTFAVYKKLN
jgi:hypothetical protein